MKTAHLIASLLAAGSLNAFGQVEVQTYSGSLVGVSPEGSSLMISASAGAQPVSYTYSRETQFVDGAGNAISYEAIRRDTPVRVEYVSDGEIRRVRRVIVQPVVTQSVGLPTATQTTVVQQPAAVVQPVPAVTRETTTTTTTVTRDEDDDD